MLGRLDVWNAIRVSLFLSVVVTAVSAVICRLAAYAFARLQFPGIFFSSLGPVSTNRVGLVRVRPL